MSHLDPYGGGHSGWGRQDETLGWDRPDRDDERARARHAGAAPDDYGRHAAPVAPWSEDPWAGAHDPIHRYRDDHHHRRRAYPGRAAPRYGYPAPADPAYPGMDPGHRRPEERPFGYGQQDGHHRWAHDIGAVGDPDPADEFDPGNEMGPVGEAELDTAAWPVVDSAVPPRQYRGRRRAGGDRRSGRAGRNLPAAIGVGLALGVAILAPLFLIPAAFLAVVAVAVGIGTWEMARAVRNRAAHPPMLPLIAGGLLMTGLAWRAGTDGLGLGLLVTVLAVMVWRLADGPDGYQRDVVTAALIAVYVPFLAGFAVLLVAPPDGAWRVVATLAAVVLSDTGGYAVGVFFGRHKMAPTVSPGKSWEGFAGSVASTAIGSALLLALVLDVDLQWGALFGLTVSVAAVLGDLCESLIKRDLGVKDMSRLLPGHGGLMDRLDSILFAVPTAYLLLSVIVPTH